MSADAVLRLAARLTPASQRERYVAEWASEASELAPGERLGFAVRVLVRTPSLRFALRPGRAAAALAGGGVLGTGDREGGRAAHAFALVTALCAPLWGLGVVTAGLTLRVYCATAGCVPLELARVPEDQEAFMAGPLAWTQIWLYSPFSLFVLGLLSLFGLLCVLGGWFHVARGSRLKRAFAIAFVLLIVAWVGVVAFAPEMDYVTNLTE